VRICCAANEDGLGPSALAFHLVRAVIRAWNSAPRQRQLEIVLLNRAAEAFNRSLYASRPEVRVASVDSLVKLERKRGEVHAAATVDLLRGYARCRDEYAAAIRALLQGCAVAIDIGVPLVCVEECQWQVRLIERNCRQMGVIPEYPECALGVFSAHPAECIDLFVSRRHHPTAVGIRAGVEHELAASILADRFLERATP